MSGEKTEKPTRKKLEDAKKKGQVAVSKDSQILAKLICFYMFVFAVFVSYIEKINSLLASIVQVGFLKHSTFDQAIFDSAIQLFFYIVVPIVAVCVVSSIGITWAQTGFVVAPESIVPSFKKMDAVENIKNMFSKKSFIQLILSVLKVIVLVWIGSLVFMSNVTNIIRSYRNGIESLFYVFNQTIQNILIYSLSVFVILTVIDWSVVYMSHIKKLKMSLQDIKDENKQTQGNPENKKNLKREHRNILNSSLNKVSTAKAVVTNPTHIAVALDYEPGVHDIPFILAMGADDVAAQIRKEATKHGIPIVQNVALARMLYNDCGEDEYIQRAHLELAAEVFRLVMELKKN